MVEVPTPTTDILFLAWNRRRFTEFTFQQLLANTEWERVNELHVYDDGSTDGTAEMLFEMIHEAPVRYHLTQTDRLGPVGAMNHYVENNGSTFFAKVDNDIVVPPDWLGRMLEVMTGAEVGDYVQGKWSLDALGMEAGRMGAKENLEGWEHARWIGGVGLIRTEAIGGRPAMVPRGEGLRFGWTEFQQEYGLRCGWVCPDLMVSSLDQVPLEPWITLAREYCMADWSRAWPKYHERWMEQYWGWWT